MAERQQQKQEDARGAGAKRSLLSPDLREVLDILASLEGQPPKPASAG